MGRKKKTSCKRLGHNKVDRLYSFLQDALPYAVDLMQQFETVKRLYVNDLGYNPGIKRNMTEQPKSG